MIFFIVCKNWSSQIPETDRHIGLSFVTGSSFINTFMWKHDLHRIWHTMENPFWYPCTYCQYTIAGGWVLEHSWTTSPGLWHNTPRSAPKPAGQQHGYVPVLFLDQVVSITRGSSELCPLARLGSLIQNTQKNLTKCSDVLYTLGKFCGF